MGIIHFKAMQSERPRIVLFGDDGIASPTTAIRVQSLDRLDKVRVRLTVDTFGHRTTDAYLLGFSAEMLQYDSSAPFPIRMCSLYTWEET